MPRSNGPTRRPAICAGPLLELDDRGVPDWTYLWEGDFQSILRFMLDHVRAWSNAIAAKSTSGKSPPA